MCKDLFTERYKQVKIKKAQIADDYYNTLYSNVILKWINESPEGGLVSSPNIRFRINRVNYEFTMSKSRRFLFKDYSETFVLPTGSLFMERILSITDEFDQIQKEENEVRSMARGIIYSVNTTKRLIEIWPKCVNWIPKDLSVLNLPSINVASLDSLICTLTEKRK